MIDAWQGNDSVIPLGEELLTSVHIFERESIKAYREAHKGMGDLNGSEIPHACPWLTWDFDKADKPVEALKSAEILIRYLMKKFSLGEDDDVFRLNLSGKKGAHLRLWNPLVDPTNIQFTSDAARRHKALAMQLAAEACVDVDRKIYAVGNLIRVPNSRHPVSGRRAVPVPINELLSFDWEAIVDPSPTAWIDASKPRKTTRFLWPTGLYPASFPEQFRELWEQAALTVAEVKLEQATAAKVLRDPVSGRFNFKPARFVQEIFENGYLNAGEGGRANEIYRLANHLAERGIPLQAAWGLTKEAITASGITEKEGQPHFQRGWNDGWKKRFPGWDDTTFGGRA
jgi:hypothetical protein